MKLYEMIIDDGKELYRVNRLAKNEKELRNTYGGNGEIVRVKDITDSYPINLDSVYNALNFASVGETERELIVECIRQVYPNIIN